MSAYTDSYREEKPSSIDTVSSLSFLSPQQQQVVRRMAEGIEEKNVVLLEREQSGIVMQKEESRAILYVPVQFMQTYFIPEQPAQFAYCKFVLANRIFHVLHRHESSSVASIKLNYHQLKIGALISVGALVFVTLAGSMMGVVALIGGIGVIVLELYAKTKRWFDDWWENRVADDAKERLADQYAWNQLTVKERQIVYPLLGSILHNMSLWHKWREWSSAKLPKSPRTKVFDSLPFSEERRIALREYERIKTPTFASESAARK